MERMRNISIFVSKSVMTTRPSRRQTSEEQIWTET